MKKTMLKLFAVLAIFAFTLTSCGKDGGSGLKKKDCTDPETLEKWVSSLSNYTSGVEACEDYKVFLKDFFKICLGDLPNVIKDEVNKAIAELESIDCSDFDDK